MTQEKPGTDLLGTLRELFNTLGPQQQAIARYLLENPTDAVFHSAATLGKRTGTHAATVVRLAQRLGYDGFPDLQADLRAQTVHNPPLLDMADRVVQSGSTEEIISLSFNRAAQNMERAISSVDAAVLDEIVAVLLGCRRVLVLGMGTARPVAVHLASSLRHAGLDVHEAGDMMASAQEIALLGADDVAFTIDYHRYYRETVHFAAAARRRGASVCALTDSTTSALAPFADHLLVTPSEAAATPRTSLAASMVAVEVLLATITNASRERTRTTMQEIDDEYRQVKIFTATREPNPATEP